VGADGARLHWPWRCWLAIAASERLHRRLKARASPERGQKTDTGAMLRSSLFARPVYPRLKHTMRASSR
jgi:hypothetical protein